MSDYSVIAEREIYPRLFEIVDRVPFLSDFGFKKKGNKWTSTTKRKVDGTDDKTDSGFVNIYENKPHGIKDFHAPMKAITTYLQEQGICSSWPDAIKYLARETGVSLPEKNLSDEDIEKIKKKEKQTELFETINDFFIMSLIEEKGSEADFLRKYLDGRGYTEYLPKTHNDINENNKMELGFFPSQEKLKEYLKSVNIESEVIDSLFIKDVGSFHMKGFGFTNQLTIPYRDHSGRIIGFTCRDINYTKDGKTKKYLNTSGLDKQKTLFKLSRLKNKIKELVIVEGYLDAVILKALSIDNVTALGGTSLNEDQVKLAKQMGAESITLWLDIDEEGIKATNHAIDTIRKSNVGIKTYVIEMPSEYKAKDPDELIRDYGIDAYHKVIKTARPWYIYRLDKALNKLKEESSWKDRDYLLNEISQLGSKISDPIESSIYKKHLEVIGEKIGVSGEAMKIAIDNIKQEKEKEKQQAVIKKGLDSAQSHIKIGDVEKALIEIKNIDKQIITNTRKINYDDLIVPDNEEEITKELKRKPDSIYSGYSIINPQTNMPYKINIPSGAITTIAAATGHGKTTALTNIALNLFNEMPPDKAIYFFTFEEARPALYIKILNAFINEQLDSDNRAYIERMLKNGDRDLTSKLSVGRERFIKEIMSNRKLKINYVTFSANELIKAIHYAYEYGNAGAIIIDYVQLLQVDNDKGFNNRQEEVKELCIELHKCGKETGLPLIAAAQFNREVTDESHLHATNIREAGDIEQVSSLILGLWNRTKKPEKEKIDTFIPTPYIYMRILKNREQISEIGQAFHFDGNTGKISNTGITPNSDSKKATVTEFNEYMEASRGS